MNLPGSGCQEATEIIRGCGPTACPRLDWVSPEDQNGSTQRTSVSVTSRHRTSHRPPPPSQRTTRSASTDQRSAETSDKSRLHARTRRRNRRTPRKRRHERRRPLRPLRRRRNGRYRTRRLRNQIPVLRADPGGRARRRTDRHRDGACGNERCGRCPGHPEHPQRQRRSSIRLGQQHWIVVPDTGDHGRGAWQPLPRHGARQIVTRPRGSRTWLSQILLRIIPVRSGHRCAARIRW